MEQMKLTDGITLLSGARFSYEHPEQSQVTIEDIAGPLSNICRFAGQLPYFYSVAQHLVNTARLVEPKFRYTALMHDTAESFTNDIVTPLKVAVPLFKTLETRIEGAMGERFQFQYPFPPEVHEADRQMLALEMKYIRGQDPADHAHLNGVNIDGLENLVDLTSWSPEEAYRRFKKAWIILRPSELSA